MTAQRAVLLAVLLLAAHAAAALCPALAAEWYVDNQAGGLNTGGSWADAWQSFSDIDWSAVSPGDTVYLSGGSTSKTYTEDLTVRSSGESASPITVTVGQEAGHNGTVVIRGAGVYLESNSHLVVTGEYRGERRLRIQDSPEYAVQAGSLPMENVRIAYLEIAGCRGTYNVYVRGEPRGVEVDHLHVHHPAHREALLLIFWEGSADGYGTAARIHHNIFDLNGVGEDAVRLASGGYDVYGNDIRARGTQPSHNDGIQVFTSVPISFIRIFDNRIADAGNWSIGISADQPLSNLLIYNNVLDLTGSDSGTRKGIFIRPGSGTSSDSIHVYNNTIVGAGALGIELDVTGETPAGMSNLKIRNNLLYESNSITINQLFGEVPGLEVRANCLWASNPFWQQVHYNGVSYAPPFTVLNQGGTDRKPLLADPAARDFHLAESDQVCRDRGEDLSSFFTADKDGIPRPQGAGWDTGAYERPSLLPPTGLRLVGN
jgi:hypothetical protein